MFRGMAALWFVWCDCHVKAAGARYAPPTGAAAYHKPDLQGTVLTVPKHESIASFRLCAGNHPSVCAADSSPQRGAKHDLRQDIGSPGGELDAKRPEGWFLAANLKQSNPTPWNSHCARRHLALPQIPSRPIGQGLGTVKTVPYRTFYHVLPPHKIAVGRCARRRVSEAKRTTGSALRLEMGALTPSCRNINLLLQT